MLSLTNKQREVLIGTILGDGCLESCKNDARLQILHSEVQYEYVFWKYGQLRDWTLSSPKRIEMKDSRYQKINYGWRFRTKSHKVFTELKELFYKSKRKIVPKNINFLLSSPFTLAVWYMDDGGRRKDCRGMFLNSLNYTLEENKKLQRCLQKNFQIDSRLHWISDGYRIYIPSASSKLFCQIIAPYVIPSMIYKLPYDPVTTDPLPLYRKRRDKRYLTIVKD